jgi:hypothetical protein
VLAGALASAHREVAAGDYLCPMNGAAGTPRVMVRDVVRPHSMRVYSSGGAMGTL